MKENGTPIAQLSVDGIGRKKEETTLIITDLTGIIMTDRNITRCIFPIYIFPTENGVRALETACQSQW